MSEQLAFSRPEIKPEDMAAVARVLESGWITTGKEVKAFEAELAAYVGIDHVVTVSSATTAEEICLAFLFTGLRSNEKLHKVAGQEGEELLNSAHPRIGYTVADRELDSCPSEVAADRLPGELWRSISSKAGSQVPRANAKR